MSEPAPNTEIRRHRTAIGRAGFSRPIRLALEAGLIDHEQTVFDYGCGRGQDVARLAKRGISASGWDPTHRPDTPCKPADVVNLGYVLNVIEDPAERRKALENAWALAEGLLIVGARLDIEGRDPASSPFADGCKTRANTFQKLFTQHELREWVATTLERPTLPAAPGVILVFRDEARRQSYLAARYQRRRAAPRIRQADRLYEQHYEVLQPLLEFLTQRGRLPEEYELPITDELTDAVGSIRQSRDVLRRVHGDDFWKNAAQERSTELLIHLALEKITGRPKFTELPGHLQLDIKAFFKSYRAACRQADELLHTAGDADQRLKAMHASPVGKLTGKALYVHEDALAALSAVLRVYEGCARQHVGDTEGGNVIKLSRRKPKVSYLSYPHFRNHPHPLLRGSLSVPLDGSRIRYSDFRDTNNPSVLHRKELMVTRYDPDWQKFHRLTQQEIRWGLFCHPELIGTQAGWHDALARTRATLRGHRVVRSK